MVDVDGVLDAMICRYGVPPKAARLLEEDYHGYEVWLGDGEIEPTISLDEASIKAAHRFGGPYLIYRNAHGTWAGYSIPGELYLIETGHYYNNPAWAAHLRDMARRIHES